MKKIYLLAFSICIGSTLLAQISVKEYNKRFEPTRENTSHMTIQRVEGTNSHVGMRAVFLTEDFEGVAGPLPADIPDTWATVTVTQTQGTATTGDDTVGPAFTILDSELANDGGYWPVTETGNGNQFAGANDDAVPCNCDMEQIFLETPSINFSTAEYPAVTFDIYHDKNFLGGDAFLSVSTDGGANWTDLQYPQEADGFLPDEEGNWQTIVMTLFEYIGEADVRIRFNWSDNNQWASGFAVDNVVVGDLEEHSLTLDKTVNGDWNQDNFGLGFWDYSIIPVTQASPVHATSVVSNNGFNDLNNVNMNIEVFQNATSVGTWTGTPTDVLFSLTKDTMSVVAEFVPDQVGEYSVVATASSDANGSETDLTDNTASTSFEMSECTYARDLGGAQAFMLLEEGGDFAGNLFDIYAPQEFTSIQFAIGAGSVVGSSITGLVFDFLGLEADGPVFELVEGSETEEVTVTEASLNGVNDAIFTCMNFIQPLTLQADHVYLVAVSGSDSLRVPVSGSNVWVASWRFDSNAFTATSGIPMVRLMGNCGELEASCFTAVSEKEANTSLNQNMPNPANGSTTIVYTVKRPSRVTLTVTSMTGQVVESVDLGNRSYGKFNYELNVEDYAPGVYTYTISDGMSNTTRKMIVE